MENKNEYVFAVKRGKRAFLNFNGWTYTLDL